VFGFALSVMFFKESRLAGSTAAGSAVAAGVILLLAAARGLELSVSITPTLLAIALLVALHLVRLRHEKDGGDNRLAASVRCVSALYVGGLSGALLCLVGQTFARPLIDPLLHQGDLMLGVDVRSLIDATISVAGLAPLLAAAYQSSFPLLFGTALYLAWTGKAGRAYELCGIFNVCLLIVAISSAVIPAVGAFHHLSIPSSLLSALPAGSGTYHLEDLFALREAKCFVVDPSHLQGVATFPSFHTALALMTAAAWRDFPRAWIAMCFWQALVLASTIPIGGHYVVDLFFGAGVWFLVFRAWQWHVRNTPTETWSPQGRPGFV
jgi:membrane-associated phospholipid phosphatase